ncbi:hypothetical protein KP509_11G056600 [Ceratopteris richardii]|nr:hypothetical protein KP509_11G056600 [Ceratopteris richardii]
MRDVFGDSDEEEQAADDVRQSPRAPEMSASDDEASIQRGIRPEDIVPDEEQQEQTFESDDEHTAVHRPREKPLGPPLHINIPLCPPPGPADKMHIVRVSNIMGIESKPFDPKTYIAEEEQFITDEAGQKQRLRLEDNVVRWRKVRDRDGNVKCESNARFVKWSDGSMQLLIGNEVLNISVQRIDQDHGHLYMRHDQGLFQSQGRLLQKMKFMPSSLTSKSHRLLTALVDSRNRKIYKVKNVITNKDPEREKEEAEKLHQKRIRTKEDLQRKQDKINRKYMPIRDRAEQLSPHYLESSLMEEEEVDEYKRQMEEEQAERRIMNAKRATMASREMGRPVKSRHPSPPRRRNIEERYEESEQSEYESDEEENLGEEEDALAVEEEEEGQEEEEDEEAVAEAEESEGEQEEQEWDDEDEETDRKRKSRDEDSENEPSPPRKPVQRRRVVVSESDED